MGNTLAWTIHSFMMKRRISPDFSFHWFFNWIKNKTNPASLDWDILHPSSHASYHLPTIKQFWTKPFSKKKYNIQLFLYFAPMPQTSDLQFQSAHLYFQTNSPLSALLSTQPVLLTLFSRTTSLSPAISFFSLLPVSPWVYIHIRLKCILVYMQQLESL